MAEEISKEKFWQIYNTLPEDLQTALFSEDIGETISYVFKRQGIKNDEAESLLCEKIGDVFLGLLTPEAFGAEVKKEINSDPAAEKIVAEIGERIFYPLKNSLEKLYNVKIAMPEAIAKQKAMSAANAPVLTQAQGERLAQIICPPCPPCVAAQKKPQARPVVLRQTPAVLPIVKDKSPVATNRPLPNTAFATKTAIAKKPAIKTTIPIAKQPISRQTPPESQTSLSASPQALRRKVF